MKAFLLIFGLVVGAIALFGFYVSGTPGAVITSGLSEATAEEMAVALRLRAHTATLSNEIGERSSQRKASLARAREHLWSMLAKGGLDVVEQPFDGARGGVNLVAEVSGSSSPAEIVVVGAHYDTAASTPGADDDATGCAAVLELAARVPPGGYERTVRFVLFDRGSTRFAGSEDSGSRAFTRAAKARGERVVAMLALDGLGCYRDEPGSQTRPFPLNFFYPSRGDFVLFAGNLGSRELVRTCVGAFRDAAAFPCEGAALPGWLPGVDASDHSAFWREGWPAAVVTDTGSLRSPDIGRMTDTVDRLDFDRMSRVVLALTRVVDLLARRSTLAP